MRKASTLGSVRTKILAAVLFIAGSALFLALQSIHELERRNAWVVRTHQAIEGIEGVMNTVVSAETAERGFTISGDLGFLPPFDSANQILDQKLAALQRLVAEDSAQYQRIGEMHTLVKQRMAWMGQTVTVGKTKGIAAAQARVSGRGGKRRMDALRKVADEARRAEERLLEVRLAAQASQQTRAAVLLIVGLVGLGFLLAVAGISIVDFGPTKRRLAHIIANIGDGFYILDRDMRFTHFNAGAVAQTGVAEKDVVGKTLTEVFPQAAGGIAEAHFTEALRTGVACRFTTPSVASGKPLDVRAYPYDEGLIVLFYDVSDRVRAEEQVRKLNETLEERVLDRTAQLEAFCHTVAHDLRMHIRGLKSNIYLLREHLVTIDETVEERLQRLNRSATQMTNIVDGLLDYARNSKQEICRSRFDFSAEAQDVAERLQEIEAYARDAEIVITPGLVAEGDSRLAGVVLQNLLDNACKYRKREGDLHIDVGGDGQGGFFIRDNGRGFDPQYAERAFLPFERLHGDAAILGSGIGLANVKRILVRHGGHIRVESEPGVGTTFYFSFGGGPETELVSESPTYV